MPGNARETPGKHPGNTRETPRKGAFTNVFIPTPGAIDIVVTLVVELESAELI